MHDGSGPIDEEEAEEALVRGKKAGAGGKAAAAAGARGSRGGGGGEEQAVAPGETLWRLADVKANAPTKGRGLTRKQRDQRLRIAVEDIVSCRIHVEF